MTFTYNPSDSPDTVTLIRYHIRDTVEAAAIFTDEEISMVYAQNGSDTGKTVVSLINNIIAMISMEPDTTEDWLTISWRRSSAAWEALRAEKKKEFGLGFRISTTQTDVYRKDSLQRPTDGQTTYTPDYGDDRATNYTHSDDDKPIWE